MYTAPFQGLSDQYCVAASTNASDPVQIKFTAGGSEANPVQYRVVNNGTVPVQFVLTTAAKAAALVASGAHGLGFTILAGVTETFTGPPEAWFSCITATGTSQMCVNAGDGL